MMLERQREGIAKAKAEGKYAGRQPIARRKANDVLELYRAGVGATEIAERLKIGRSSVYRAIRTNS
jgi:DNA invertase Pin-like site-specific DNA recombinase